MEPRACQELENKVIRENLCTLCGACVGMCPYFLAHKGRVVLRDACEISQGRCYTFCPRTPVDLDVISEVLFGTSYPWNELGTLQEVLIARSTDGAIKARAQYGGVVTALTYSALDAGIIDSAVLTNSRDKSLPEGTIVSTREGVLGCSGSSYVAMPILEAFNRGAQEESRKRIGVVGIPCQVLALTKMRASVSEERDNIDKLNLVIGLFCTWALSCHEFASFLDGKVSPSDIVKIDIPPPPANIFEIHTASRLISVPLDELRDFIRPACTYCVDMTAEFADISVGAAEGIRGWNTVIVRSNRGRDLVREAQAKGIIEIEALPAQNLNHLKEASMLKKRRALRDIVQKTGRMDDLLYLKVHPGVVERLLEE